MKILFDSALDGRAWPHWPGEQSGKIGELRVGVLGMIDVLETMLGLRALTTHKSVRIASLVNHLDVNTDTFWQKSAEVDPYGVARNLLQLYDFLTMHGWQGQALSPRLKNLSLLSAHIKPGIPQKLLEILAKLKKYSGSLPEITLLALLEEQPILLQKVFRTLQQMGATFIDTHITPPLKETNDLGAAQDDNLDPQNDGSLQFIRPEGVLQAADDTAAWLAHISEKNDELTETVIIGGDAVLDSALHRYGLPATGAAADSGNSLLQLLPLVIDMGWTPPDPARIMDLLTLPASPVPPSIGRRLLSALRQWPAMGSDLWNEKLEEGIQTVEDPKRQKAVRQRLETLFASVAEKEYPTAAITLRVNMLTTWLKGRFQNDLAAHPALNQCNIFLTMLEVIELEILSEPLLKKLLDEASSAQIPLPALSAQAGLAAVPVPEAIIGHAKRIIWWNFSRDTVTSLALPLLSNAERAVLAQVGVVLPTSASVANLRAKRWRRPLDCTDHQLILICPQRDSGGNDIHPHPLWDELLAASNDKATSLISAKISDADSIAMTTPEQLPIPEPQIKWQVKAGTVKPREVESPSSLDNFLGCPFKWALGYNGKIRGGNSASLPNMTPTLGSLAHELVEEVLLQKPLPSPKNGSKLAGELFDQKAPQLVATLFQDGMEGQREDIRNTVIQATGSLLHHLHDAGVKKLNIEEHLTGQFGSQKLQGWADIVLEKPFAVIDLKRSWSKFFKKKLTSGTALQIVIYGWLLKEARGVYPTLAYYTLEDQTLLTSEPAHFSQADDASGPALEDVWKAFEATFKDAWEVLNSGVVLCSGNGGDIESVLKEDHLVMEPPCRFCDYDVLCGQRFVDT